jgi:hypothetical protein
MSGQQPWQGSDGRPYPSGQGTPQDAAPAGGGRQSNKKKSERQSFLVWISTTAGVISAICAVITLAVGTVVVVKVLSPSRTPSPGPTPSPIHQRGSTSSGSTAPDSPSPLSSARLQSLLLPVGTFGADAAIASTGTDPSNVTTICGDPRNGAVSVAYEAIENSQTGILFAEILTTWPSASAAARAVEVNSQAVDQGGSCDVTTSDGVTQQYEGSYSGLPPTSCINPGQYLATGVTESSTSFALPYQGFLLVTQCGTATISVQITEDLPGAITQQIAAGYLSRATGKLESSVS